MSERRSLSAVDRAGNALLIALVAVSYVAILSAGPGAYTPLALGLLIAFGLLYTALGVWGTPWCERVGSPWAFVAYFAVQIPLSVAIIYLSTGRAWLIMLPVVGQAAELLPRRWMVLTVSLHLAAMMVGHGLLIDEATDPSGERLYPFPSPDFWMGMLQGALQYVLAFAFVILFTRVAVREREARAEVEHLAAELREANRQLREYVTQAEELATVTERNRLAREIHDGLGHYFTAINMQIQAGRAVLEYDLSLGIDALAKAQGLAQEGLAEVRRSVAALRSSPLDNRSLPEAVGDLVDEVRAAGIATSFDVRGEVRSLSPQVELALYRAAQEGMTNMCKHAQASNAEVVLDYSDASAVRLVVGDSGVGSADPTGGYGLIGVRERVHLLGGEVHVETVPGEGFVLKVKVPG